MNKNLIEGMKIEELLVKYPFAEAFFSENAIEVTGYENKTFAEFLDKFTEEELEDMALDKELLKRGLSEYIEQMKAFLGMEEEKGVEVLTILAGNDKSGNPEGFDRLDINKSEIISIVGPTGSGKSRLLADIEWTAQRDTPTKREILINGELPDKKWRFSSNNKLVAQLSQNMNFVMDLSVREFLELHAKSRMIENIEEVTDKIIEEANNLAGEQFRLDTPVTALSGGQSRALMIADTAILSSSPIVLIDEIENAGIDRKKALDLLVSSDKIVLMATHDPTLALIANKRIIIKNGGIAKIIETSQEEKKILSKLEEMDNVIQKMRTDLRLGRILTEE
jgi:ABC transporter, ATP-binding protein